MIDLFLINLNNNNTFLYINIFCPRRQRNQNAARQWCWLVNWSTGRWLSYFSIPVQKNPVSAFELLFFAVFGQTTTDNLKIQGYNKTNNNNQPYWTEVLFKIVFGVYMLVSVVVLINLLIAMMTDTYQRIQVTSCYPYLRELVQTMLDF